VSITDERAHLARIMTPVAPPRVVDDVYTDDQYRRLVGVIQDKGPWPTITSHHFTSVEQLIATATGVVPDGHGLTLDDLATAHFRGFFAQNSVCFHPEIEDCFHNPKFLQMARDYWGAAYAQPTLMLFNICGPHQCSLFPHTDATTYRGVRFENSPVWLMNIMTKSGLFTDWLVKMAQVITWWYTGERGTFTYWPDGPLVAPQHLTTPMWNRGVVVQNELMFHRGDPVGRPEERDIPGFKHRSEFAYRRPTDDWAISTDGDVVRSYRPDEIRLLVHWNAQVYDDMAEYRMVTEHTDDLTHEQVFGMLLDDLRRRGVHVAEPSDPYNDIEFITALVNTYSMMPETDWLTPETA
jgi:hypothetical protein